MNSPRPGTTRAEDISIKQNQISWYHSSPAPARTDNINSPQPWGRGGREAGRLDMNYRKYQMSNYKELKLNMEQFSRQSRSNIIQSWKYFITWKIFPSAVTLLYFHIYNHNLEKCQSCPNLCHRTFITKTVTSNEISVFFILRIYTLIELRCFPM